MKQKEQAVGLIIELYHDALSNKHTKALEEVLEMAQNSPPEGKSDGSIGPELFDNLAEVHKLFRRIQILREEAITLKWHTW